ncbi:MAG: type II toxin-antitoxin system VapC family toxin [Planctomycetales bacterium]
MIRFQTNSGWAPMRILLDTHTFLWWVDKSERLTATAAAACRDRSNELVLSIASVWEIQIKVQLGKLDLSAPLAELVVREQVTNDLRLLNIRYEHVLAVDALPLHHRDPFDRVLIAQATVEGLFLASSDEVFDQYPVRLIR